MKRLFTILLLTVLPSLYFQLNAQLNGTYTIGGTAPDYLTFNDAVNAMVNQGITGTVIFNVRAGTYTEQVTMPEIGGVNAGDTIVFQSENGNPASVILRYPASSSIDNWVLNLDGTDRITFKDLTIMASGTSDYGKVLIIGNESKYVRFENVIFQGKTGTTNVFTDKTIVDGEASLIDSFIHFKSCQFINGKYAIRYKNGVNLKITGCTFNNTNNGGTDCYLTYNQFLFYAGNVHMNGGINVYYYSSPNSNIIANNFIAGKLDLSYLNGSSGTETKVVNNMIIGQAHIRSSRWVNFYNNTVYNPSGVALLVNTYNQQGNSSNLRIANNILVSDNNTALDLEDLVYIDYLDYNWYNTGGTNLLTLNNFGYPDLATWQISTGRSAHAVNDAVHFVSSTDLHICRDQAPHHGDPMVGVPVDFDLDPRNLMNPMMGADEYDPWQITPDPAQVCAGENLTLSVNNTTGNDNFTWSGGDLTSPVSGTSLTVSPTSDQDYLLDWSDGVCSVTDTVHVTVFPAPNPTIVVNNHTLSSDITGASYQWYFNGSPINGATSQSYTATQNGDYYVVVIDTNGCSGTSNTVTINNVGIQTPDGFYNLNIHPNPGPGMYKVQFTHYPGINTHLRVINLVGRTVYEEQLNDRDGKADFIIDLRQLPDGVYLMQLQNGSYSEVIRLVKQ